MSAITRIYEICATLNRWGGQLTGLDFADERGWLSAEERAERAELEVAAQTLRAEGEQLWRELPSAEIERYEVLARSAVQTLEHAGGKRDGFYAESLGPRALATCSPQRVFDFWAIWAVQQVTDRKSS